MPQAAARSAPTIDGVARLVRAWRTLPPDRRLAALASLALFLTLFLPWYQQSVIARSPAAKNLQAASESISGWGAFSFVEAAVLLVAVGVLVLLFHRAEGRAFHLPGGDGWVIAAAGMWTCFLVVWRMFDKQGTTNHGQYALTDGIEWGIFVTLFVAAWLAWAGTRIRAAHQPEPPLPGQDDVVFDGRWHAAGTPATQARRTPRAPRPPRSANRRRSTWSPAERPEWSDSERATGWLTAPPVESTDHPATPEPSPPSAPPAAPIDQLTIRFDGDE